MTRRDARDAAFKLVFQLIAQNETAENIIELYYLEHKPSGDSRRYIEDAINGVAQNIDAIDEKISSLLEGWKLERVSKVALCALRLSLYELTYRDDIPQSVSINEAVSITKKYGGEEAASFVNGMLASFTK